MRWVLAVGVTLAGPALAQSAGDPSSFGGLLETFGLKAKPSVAPGFVEKARPRDEDLHYIPVGAPHVASPVKTMTAAELAAATDALDHARVAQQLKAGVKPPPVPLKTAAGDGSRKKTIH